MPCILSLNCLHYAYRFQGIICICMDKSGVYLECCVSCMLVLCWCSHAGSLLLFLCLCSWITVTLVLNTPDANTPKLLLATDD